MPVVQHTFQISNSVVMKGKVKRKGSCFLCIAKGSSVRSPRTKLHRAKAKWHKAKEHRTKWHNLAGGGSPQRSWLRRESLSSLTSSGWLASPGPAFCPSAASTEPSGREQCVTEPSGTEPRLSGELAWSFDVSSYVSCLRPSAEIRVVDVKKLRISLDS